ncbi:MAG: SRPBCC family protein [Bacteroidota bacterium]
MPIIKLETEIKTDIRICFDLARSIDFHKLSTGKTKEQAIDGKTSGLIGLDEFVTWQATHFGLRQKLTSRITAFENPSHFRDEQEKGPFKLICHDHYFEQKADKVNMKDVFYFESPFGIFGRLFNQLILTKYLTKFIVERNTLLKEFTETDKWKTVLKEEEYL